MSVLPDSMVGWIVIAVLLFWFVGAYNRLVRLRAAVLQAYATLDAALRKQLDFVQASITAALPEKDASSHSSAVAPLQAATTQLATLLGATRLHPLDPGGMAALATALQVLITAWQRQHPDAVTVFEADGTLSRPAPLLPAGAGAASGTLEPMAWPEPSAAAEIARSQFNLAVGQYNAAIVQFPALLVAWMVRLRPAAPLL
ncbi:LemA protein [Variovorax beijingensis]|uniref:LemA protein n=1 Tax=Variovorax beijingensis TaxID=2496117 RepID=A0A561C7L8_9BURK|nr:MULTISPECIES: LemA family protein [Variovorax]MBD9666616.1 lema family protein [Variovorax sp. VRV01]MDR6452838.1 LemA protein [Variovorax paradoxus]TWD87215.1 LemA protein [Variovorax beijingensis]